MKYFLSLFSILLFCCAFFSEDEPVIERMNGLSFVAPPKPFKGNPMEEVKAVDADYIAVIPIAYTRPSAPTVRYNESSWQWWGERPEGVEKTIDLANENGINVLLKPQVYVPGSWTGGLDFSDEDWAKWEKEYRDYMMPMARLAEEKEVKVFCIGTEFKMSTAKREQFWREFIRDVRKVYSGKLTYAANWDEYKTLTFWDDLDFIGIDAYFPLSDAKTPTVAELREAWKTPLYDIERIQKKFDKPVIFTEYGYMSVDGCAGKTWEIEPKVHALAINEQAQANAVQALHEVFSKKEYWAGGFIWKWFPEMKGHEGYPAKDYTPQGKITEKTLRECFSF
ncbi:MAG: hypothetical protein ACI85O_000027 [Saprospiraceae bacterium]|jgi:hypothetical protein